MFVALLESDKRRVEAVDAVRKQRHICPRCFDFVILHRAGVNRANFKHGKNSACPFGKSESWQHEQAKAAILAGARARGLNAEPEFEVISIDGDRRADVVVLAPAREPATDDRSRCRAFEVQYSAISYQNLMVRSNAYMSAGVPVLWIPVIDVEKFKPSEMYSIVGTRLICLSGYSAPIWVEDIARLHRRLWIYVPQTNGFWRAWIMPHWSYKNPSNDGQDSNGNYYSGSNGYWRQAAKKRDLYLDGPHPFEALRIVAGNHSDNQVIAPNGEKRWLVELLPDGKETALFPPIEQRRTQHFANGRNTGDYVYVEWLTTAEVDRKVQFSCIEMLPKIDDSV